MGRVIVTNRKAHRDYIISEKLECGIELRGSEVKSLRAGKASLDDSFARIEKNEIILYNMYISPYEQASYLNVESKRPRKLLLHRRQIEKLAIAVSQKGSTLVPLGVYLNERGFVKIELGLCKGKKLYDKREDIKRREIDLEMRRVIKNKRK